MRKPKSRQINVAKSRRKENSGKETLTEWTPAITNLVTRNISREFSHMLAASRKAMRVRSQSHVKAKI